MWHLGKIFLSLYFTILAAPAISESAILVDSDFNEVLRSSANTGGTRVIGLQVIGNNEGAELQVYLPKDWQEREFCVRTRSSDALYDSENTYRRPNLAAQNIDVPHITQTDHRTKLASLGQDAYAVRVFLAACDRVDEQTENAIALWRDGNFRNQITLFVNSLGADRIAAILTQGLDTAEHIFCEPVVADVKVAFDLVCTLDLIVKDTSAEIELLPFKNGKMQRSETVLIALP